MVEPSRTQLQMMLVQQSGPGALPLSILSPNSFLPFLRTVEQMAIDERLAPVVVYWSRQTAARFLPGGQRYRELIRDAFCVSIFSEDRNDPPDEWCFLIESRGLCLIVYGQQAMESPDADKFQCSGSMDPQIVRQAFNRLLPIWQSTDISEANRLEDARVNLGPCGSAAPYLQKVRSAWPVIKAPIQQNLMLQPQESGRDDGYAKEPTAHYSSDGGKVSPIALDHPSIETFKYGSPFNKTPAIPAGMPLARSSSTSSSTAVPVPVHDIPSEEFDVPTESTDNDGDGNGKRRGHGAGEGEGRRRQDEAEELSAFPPAAQAIISDIIGQLRHSNDLA